VAVLFATWLVLHLIYLRARAAGTDFFGLDAVFTLYLTFFLWGVETIVLLIVLAVECL
jgi:hypothetical protein